MVKIFVKKDCPKCPLAMELGNKLKTDKLKVEIFDASTAEGLAEAAFYNVISLPAVIIENSEGDIAAKWTGEVPKKGDIVGVISCLNPASKE